MKVTARWGNKNKHCYWKIRPVPYQIGIPVHYRQKKCRDTRHSGEPCIINLTDKGIGHLDHGLSIVECELLVIAGHGAIIEMSITCQCLLIIRKTPRPQSKFV